MYTITSAQARKNIAEVMNAAEPVLITRRGTTSKVVIDEAEYQRMTAELRRYEAASWKEDNAEAIAHLNKLGEETGCFSDEYRAF